MPKFRSFKIRKNKTNLKLKGGAHHPIDEKKLITNVFISLFGNCNNQQLTFILNKEDVTGLHTYFSSIEYLPRYRNRNSHLTPYENTDALIIRLIDKLNKFRQSNTNHECKMILNLYDIFNFPWQGNNCNNVNQVDQITGLECMSSSNRSDMMWRCPATKPDWKPNKCIFDEPRRRRDLEEKRKRADNRETD
jgi:hypothetical protein